MHSFPEVIEPLRTDICLCTYRTVLRPSGIAQSESVTRIDAMTRLRWIELIRLS